MNRRRIRTASALVAAVLMAVPSAVTAQADVLAPPSDIGFYSAAPWWCRVIPVACQRTNG